MKEYPLQIPEKIAAIRTAHITGDGRKSNNEVGELVRSFALGRTPFGFCLSKGAVFSSGI